MTLRQALRILVDAHLREDRDLKYIVESLPHLDTFVTRAEYIAAWGVVWDFTHNGGDSAVSPTPPPEQNMNSGQ